MKKLFFCIILSFAVFYLSGCSYDLNVKMNNSMPNIEIQETEKYDIDWDQLEFPVDLNLDFLHTIKPLKTNDDAKNIAYTLLEKCHEEGMPTTYKFLTGIVHSTSDNIWVFQYTTDMDIWVESETFHVAIDGNECTLIKAWVEEG